MNTTQAIGEENRYIVKKVSLIDTLRGLPIGKPVIFDCREVGSFGTVNATRCRLINNGEGDWRLETSDNGVHYTVTRLA